MRDGLGKFGVRVLLGSGALLLGVMVGSASAIPIGWTCIGVCGTLGPDGVVTAPPGGGGYEYVTTAGSPTIGALDLGIGSETNGSVLRSGVFGADAGDELLFNFNYVTSDGAGYIEYAWARLLDETLTPVALLFTARTNPTVGADTVPGFGLPAIVATMTPSSTPIIPGGPAWSPLGGYSGACYSTGCGYTGWIESSYIVPDAGNYILEFGVVNWIDTIYDSGMAIAGATIGGDPIGPSSAVPEPGTLLLLGSGLAMAARRRMRKQA
jgi:hypothetical protein